ncbi:MAG: hypothetical protein ACXWTL_04445 [Methylobacter sp.]
MSAGFNDAKGGRDQLAHSGAGKGLYSYSWLRDTVSPCRYDIVFV